MLPKVEFNHYSHFPNAIGNQSPQNLEWCLGQSSHLINKLVGIYRSVLSVSLGMGGGWSIMRQDPVVATRPFSETQSHVGLALVVNREPRPIRCIPVGNSHLWATVFLGGVLVMVGFQVPERTGGEVQE